MSKQSLQKSKSMFDEIRILIEQTRQQVAVYGQFSYDHAVLADWAAD